MDNPIDHPLDLGLVNYTKHPSNNDYIVFRFPDKERADSFEENLKRENMWYERDEESSKQRTYHLFGLHKSDFKKAQKMNYAVEGKHKKPLIPVAGLRYLVVLFGLLMITLSIIGYCKQQEKLASYEKSNSSVNSPNKSE